MKMASFVKMASFEKLKSDLNHTWFIDIVWKPSYVHAGRSQIKIQGQRSSEVNL